MMRGDSEASLTKARAILRKAHEEAEGQERGLRARQAAEKVWLATTTAADALVGPVSGAEKVFSAFRRAWGAEGEQIAKHVQASLHVGCFYSDAAACDGTYVTGVIRQLGGILGRPIRDRHIRRRLGL